MKFYVISIERDEFDNVLCMLDIHINYGKYMYILKFC